MSTLGAVLISIYGLVALVSLMNGSAELYINSDIPKNRRLGARLLLCGAIWPLALVVWAVLNTGRIGRGIGSLFRDATQEIDQ